MLNTVNRVWGNIRGRKEEDDDSQYLSLHEPGSHLRSEKSSRRTRRKQDNSQNGIFTSSSSRYHSTSQHMENGHGNESEGSFDDSLDDIEPNSSGDIVVSAQLIPSDIEKRALLASFDAMRRDSLFCDVSFLCHGKLYRGHRVLLSSWSRWMRSFLYDSPIEEVLTLDIFEPNAFKQVLDYMYGQPLNISVETAEEILKIVRRLELQKLEQQCWRYLMTALDGDNNAEYLHELADRFDCPALKLAAWRLLKERVPGLSSLPALRELGLQEHLQRGTGLTGPGDEAYISLNNINGRRAGLGGALDEALLPSVFRFQEELYSDDDESTLFVDEFGEDIEDEDEDDMTTGRYKRGKRGNGRRCPVPDVILSIDELTPSTPATDVVFAWAQQLRNVYERCAGTIDGENIDPNSPHLYLSDGPHTKLQRIPRTRRSGDERLISSQGVYGNVPVNNTVRPQQQIDAVDPMSLSTSIPRPKRYPVPGEVVSKSKAPPPTSRGYRAAYAIDWQSELTHLYTSLGLTSKLDSIPKILDVWRGREDLMLGNLLQKYQRQLSKEYIAYIDNLLQMCENMTESSFLRE